MNGQRKDAFIQLRGVTRSFPMGENEFRALRGIDLDIQDGKFVAIVGPSGSGKSTLMYLMGCLDTPSGGTVRLGDRELSRLSDDALSRVRNDEIGFVFQQYNLLADLDVTENIGLGMVYGGVDRAGRRQAAERFAEQFGLGEHLLHKANELSGGQMQRVAIARALAGRPKLILADEPTGNLDSKTGQEILQVFRKLHHDGHTIVLVTHDRTIAEYAERIVSIADGRIVADEKNPKFCPLEADAANRPQGEAPPREPATAQEHRSVSYVDLLRIALREGLLAKKGRTFLTMLGIIFGVAAVIAMNGITEGGKQRQLDQIRQIGLNNVQVRDKDLQGARLIRERRRNPHGINQTDIDALREHLPGLASLSAWKEMKAELRCGDRVIEDARVLGVLGDFEEVANFFVGKGRFLQDRDQENYHRVCVVGTAIAEQLGIAQDPVGQWIVVGDEPFKVAGVMGRKEFGKSEVRDLQIANRNLDVYVPYRSLRTYFKKAVHASHFDVISMRMVDEEQLIPSSGYIHHMISELHSEADDFEVTVPLEKIRQAQQTKEVFNVIIVVIAAISLLVGGIGIMNIMLATVTERTREIGVRRAQGASQRNILNQFLSEALLISLSGGAVGLAVGTLGGRLVEAAFAFPVAFNPAVMLVAVLVSMFVGVGFGIYPAWLAARMDPVEALRS